MRMSRGARVFLRPACYRITSRGRSETQAKGPTPDLPIENLHFHKNPGVSKLCT